MRKGLLAALALLLVAGLVRAQPEPASLPVGADEPKATKEEPREAPKESKGDPKEDKLPAPHPVPGTAKAALPAARLPAPSYGPDHTPTEMPAYTTSWERLPPGWLLGPPPGICPNHPCPPKPWDADRVWFRADLLVWWLRNEHSVPLFATGPQTLPVRDSERLGLGRVDHGAFPGLRIGIGGWLDDCETYGLEADYLTLARQSFGRLRTTASEPVLERPFINVNTNTLGLLVVGFPGIASGAVRITSPTYFDGFEANARYNVYRCWDNRVDAIAGFRYYNLNEELNVSTASVYNASTVLPPAVSGGGTLRTADGFHTRNQFYGGQIGAVATFQRDEWDLRVRGTVALGDTQQTVNITGGSTFVSTGGTVTTAPGGVLAQPSNIGNFTRDRFSVLPEVGIELGYRVCDHVRLSLGYTFLYWNGVARAPSQPDLAVDVAQAPFLAAPTPPTGLNRPTTAFRETDFWAQGIHFAAEIRY